MSRKLGTPGRLVARAELKPERLSTVRLMAQARREAAAHQRQVESAKRAEGQPRSYH